MTSWADELFAFSAKPLEEPKSSAVMEGFDTGTDPIPDTGVPGTNETLQDENSGVYVTTRVDIPEFYNTGSIPGLAGDPDEIAQTNISSLTIENIRSQVDAINSEYGGITVKVFDILLDTFPELNSATSEIKRNMFTTTPSSQMVIEVHEFLTAKLQEATGASNESMGERYLKLQEIVKDFKANFKFNRLGARIAILESLAAKLRNYRYDDVRVLNDVFEQVLETHPKLKEYKTNVVDGEMKSMYYFANQNGLKDMGELIRLANFQPGSWLDYHSSEYQLRLTSVAGKLEMPSDDGVGLNFIQLLNIITGKGNATDEVPLFSAVNNILNNIVKGTHGQEPLLVMRNIENHLDSLLETHGTPVTARSFAKQLACYVNTLYVLVRFLTCLDYIVAGLISFIHVVGETQSETILTQLSYTPENDTNVMEVLGVFKGTSDTLNGLNT